MKIAIIGSRGIPNQYGGFEQFAARLSAGLAGLGAEVWVYNSHDHPCRDPIWHGVHRVFCYDPEYLLGQAGQFIYDWNCISHSRRQGFDIILQLGYTSSSVWHWRLPRKPLVVTNMDGLEWSRSKYSAAVRRFLRHAEKLAVRHSDHLVADSEAIRQYLTDTYGKDATFISYGADVPESTEPSHLKDYGLTPGEYFLTIARIQPDNHLEEIIRGVLISGSSFPLIIVGCTRNVHGRYLQKKYGSERIIFLDGIYDKAKLDALRQRALLYFHGHSAGGTNPSLLEAMAASAAVCAHENPFNKAVLGRDAWYFTREKEVAEAIELANNQLEKERMTARNLDRIRTKHRWDDIVLSYLRLFEKLLSG